MKKNQIKVGMKLIARGFDGDDIIEVTGTKFDDPEMKGKIAGRVLEGSTHKKWIGKEFSYYPKECVLG